MPRHASWSAPDTVAGFAQGLPNAELMAYAEGLRAAGAATVVDIGCGAGRNGIPLARRGWMVTGIDDSRPMLLAAAERAGAEGLTHRVRLALATMTSLPVHDGSADLVVAHGIWNLAGSAAEFRTGVAEAARIARPGAGLFVFTFSRHTLPAEAEPVAGEPFVFTQFSGEPQCFLTEEQLVNELAAAGFAPDPDLPLRELNRSPGLVRHGAAPVIFQAAFRR
jgi:SAM-dependent methyltransferase